ncbi:hypothetical protein QEN19_002659 [Hanseniaspora menglaensis]
MVSKDYDLVKGVKYTLASGKSYYTRLRPDHRITDDDQENNLDNPEYYTNRFNNNHHVRLKNEEIFDTEKLKMFFLKEGRLTNIQTTMILEKASAIFKKEENLIKLNKMPINIVGDIHGQFYDLMKLFEVNGDLETANYLFMGDYVDRGVYSVETLLFLYVLKINHPDRIFMLRGNHECKHLTTYFTFKSEVLHKYHDNNYEKESKTFTSVEIYKYFCLSFNCLPLAALLNDQYFCVHGGISPELELVSDVNTKIPNRFKEVPSKGLMCDLLWSDPLDDYDTYEDDELFIDNHQRGCSYMYTFTAVENFLINNNILCVIRAHEAQDLGYRMYRNSSSINFPSLITVFSAPNYLDSYNNKGAILKFVNNTMNIRQFNYVRHPYNLPKFMDVFTWSLPFVGEKVSEMLLGVLNICSEDELQCEIADEEYITKILEKPDIAKPSYDKDSNLTNEEKETLDQKSIAKKTLRKKILAISKISKMYSLLKEESMSIQTLRDLNGGSLPKGTLYGNKNDLLSSIDSFKKSKELDAINERLPPNLKQEHALQKLKDLNNSASVIGSHDDIQHNMISMLLDEES